MFRVFNRKVFCIGILAFTVTSAMARGRAGFGGPQAKSGGGGMCVLSSMPLQALDGGETAKLLHMREEEKLARDFYQTMYSLWGDRIFQRISVSEQRHMDAIAVLLNRYELNDPVAGNNKGEFSSIELQSMYHNLVTTGQQSRIDALRSGAMIEDMDLYDLEEALSGTDNSDLEMVYKNLIRGSQNHMRAFAARLQTLGETYVPEYISDQELTEILAYGKTSAAEPAGTGRGTRQRGFGRGLTQGNGNTSTQ